MSMAGHDKVPRSTKQDFAVEFNIRGSHATLDGVKRHKWLGDITLCVAMLANKHMLHRDLYLAIYM